MIFTEDILKLNEQLTLACYCIILNKMYSERHFSNPILSYPEGLSFWYNFGIHWRMSWKVLLWNALPMKPNNKNLSDTLLKPSKRYEETIASKKSLLGQSVIESWKKEKNKIKIYNKLKYFNKSIKKYIKMLEKHYRLKK